MTIYILAHSAEGEIEMTQHNTYVEAFDKMRAALSDALGVDSNNLEATNTEGLVAGVDFDIDRWSAWTAYMHHKNVLHSWVIKKIEV